MDATRWRSQRRFLVMTGLISILASLNLACGDNTGTVNSESLNGAQCANQVKQNSFLVKWNNTVPSEYAGNRIGPNSLITRFKEIDKATVEKEILQKHLNDYIVAEPEFYVEDIHINDTTPPTSVNAWGPGDIQASDAWNLLGKKGDGIIVAVVDSGIDMSHPLLQSQIWVNKGEIPNNGIDDDHDGYVDDYNGYNFNANSIDLTDGANHGTHVSGIIAGQAGTNNFTGIAPNAKIMPLKFIDSTGSGAVGDAISAMEYASAHGAQVINASWGGSECSTVLQQEIITTTQSGTVFVNAAGNSSANLITAPEWPAAYQVPGKITVASYNLYEMLSSFSNYGALVDLAAPGENILSTVPPAAGQSEGNLGVKSGTSMATPFVAGVAALLLSARPTASAVEIANAINGGVIVGQGFGVRTSGKVNALGAANYLLSH